MNESREFEPRRNEERPGYSYDEPTRGYEDEGRYSADELPFHIPRD